MAYLGEFIAAPTAADADKLDGHDSAYFEPHDTNILKVSAIGISVAAQGSAEAAVTTHTLASDPHPVYTTAAEAAAAAPVQLVAGKSGMVVLTKGDVGLGNVDNTSDASKPISTATAAALGSKADLVGGVVPSNQLPSYVDDVLEYSTLSAFPGTGEAGKIYIAIDTNLTYRWSGSVYTKVASDLALGETSATAYRGDRGKIAYDHSQTVHATQYTDEMAQDAAASLISAGTHTGISFTYNDVDNAISATVNAIGGVAASAQNSSFNAVKDHRYVCDTTAAAFTCTLPATPTIGDYLEFEDAGGTWAVHSLTLARNGLKINGLAEDLICNVSGLRLEMTYVSTAFGWHVSTTASTVTLAPHTTISHSDWPAAVSMTEVGFLDGVTSSIQTQLNSKGVGDVTLTGTQTLTNKTINYADNTLTGVQPTLVSGTSIKTINGGSILGSGDIAVGGLPGPKIVSRLELAANTGGTPGYLTPLQLSGGREIVFYARADALFAVVYSITSDTYGTPTLIRSALNIYMQYTPVVLSDGRICVTSWPSSATSMESVLLTVTDLAISVGTAATATTSQNINQVFDAVVVGTSVVISYYTYGASGSCELRAINCSGATPTIGAATAATVADSFGQVFYITGSVVCWITVPTSGYPTATPYTVSGSTLSAGTPAPAPVAAGSPYFTAVQLRNSRRILFFHATNRVCLVSVTGTVASIAQGSLSYEYTNSQVCVADTLEKVVAALASASPAVVIGTSTGTPVNEGGFLLPSSGVGLHMLDDNTVCINGRVSTYSRFVGTMDISGASPADKVIKCCTYATTYREDAGTMNKNRVYCDGSVYWLSSAQYSDVGALSIDATGNTQIVNNIPTGSADFYPVLSGTERVTTGSYGKYERPHEQTAAWAVQYTAVSGNYYTALVRIGVV